VDVPPLPFTPAALASEVEPLLSQHLAAGYLLPYVVSAELPTSCGQIGDW
jgi:hypothetical protein